MIDGKISYFDGSDFQEKYSNICSNYHLKLPSVKPINIDKMVVIVGQFITVNLLYRKELSFLLCVSLISNVSYLMNIQKFAPVIHLIGDENSSLIFAEKMLGFLERDGKANIRDTRDLSEDTLNDMFRVQIDDVQIVNINYSARKKELIKCICMGKSFGTGVLRNPIFLLQKQIRDFSAYGDYFMSLEDVCVDNQVAHCIKCLKKFQIENIQNGRFDIDSLYSADTLNSFDEILSKYCSWLIKQLKTISEKNTIKTVQEIAKLARDYYEDCKMHRECGEFMLFRSKVNMLLDSNVIHLVDVKEKTEPCEKSIISDNVYFYFSNEVIDYIFSSLNFNSENKTQLKKTLKENGYLKTYGNGKEMKVDLLLNNVKKSVYGIKKSVFDITEGGYTYVK